MPHSCYHVETIRHPNSSYVTTKLYGTSTCGCNNNTNFSKRATFNDSYRRCMPRTLAWRRAGLVPARYVRHSQMCPQLWPSGGAVAEWVRALACTGDRTVLAGFESHCGKLRFGTLAIPFTPLCQCLSEETLKAVGPFYLMSMPGEVKYPTSPHWNV